MIKKPPESEEIKRLKLKLEIAKCQAYICKETMQLLTKSELIFSTYGAEVLALIQGNPDAVIEIFETLTQTIVVKGDTNVNFEGKPLEQVAKEQGFKTVKQLESWLKKHGREDIICQGLKVVQAPYIPTENLPELEDLFYETSPETQT